MSTVASRSSLKGARLALFVVVVVVVAVLFGLAILLWPTKAAVAMTGVIAVYAIIAGLVYVGIGLLSKTLGAGGRIGHVLLGVLYLVAFTELQSSAAFLAVFLSIMLGVLWIIEGFVSLFSLGSAGSKVLTAVFAVISIIAGVTLVTSPLWSALVLWWFLGISLVVLGAINVFRAIGGRNS